MSDDRLLAAWRGRDVLMMRTVTFIVGGRHVRGTVESISPAHEIILRTESGMPIRLGAAEATLEKA